MPSIASVEDSVVNIVTKLVHNSHYELLQLRIIPWLDFQVFAVGNSIAVGKQADVKEFLFRVIGLGIKSYRNENILKYPGIQI